MFSDNSYDKPFLVVYVNSSVFAFSLLGITLRHIAKNGWAHFKVEAEQVYHEFKTGTKRVQLGDQDRDTRAGERLLKAGHNIVCVHKGLFPPQIEARFPHLLPYARVDDLGKAGTGFP